jgi:hypothetical protein
LVSATLLGVYSENRGKGPGVFAKSQNWEGVHGETQSDLAAGVAGIQLNPNGTGAGVYGESRGRGPAGFFKGDVIVTGDINLVNADCAEDFDVINIEKVEPGTVMVIDTEGALRQSDRAYDKRVAGVISGAGIYKPGLILDKQESSQNRMPIALMGKVYCKVDASYGVIEAGEFVALTVAILEQDNAQLSSILGLIEAVALTLGSIFVGAVIPAGSIATEGTKVLDEAGKDKWKENVVSFFNSLSQSADQLIGGFSIFILNDKGILKFTWTANQDTQLISPSNESSALFLATGSKSSYTVRVEVQQQFGSSKVVVKF